MLSGSTTRWPMVGPSVETQSNSQNQPFSAKAGDTPLQLPPLLSNNGLMQDERQLLMHKLDDLRQLKRGLVEKIGARLEVRTARKWYNEGELSNKYFFNLLTRRVNDDIKVILLYHKSKKNHFSYFSQGFTPCSHDLGPILQNWQPHKL